MGPQELPEFLAGHESVGWTPDLDDSDSAHPAHAYRAGTAIMLMTRLSGLLEIFRWFRLPSSGIVAWQVHGQQAGDSRPPPTLRATRAPLT
jgi:hypothetical protein